MTDILVDDIKEADREQWLPLWDGNNQGTRNDEITAETWARLTSAVYPVHGLVARTNGKIAGLLHYILHPVTGHIEPVCYMQDLYVAPDHRRNGIGRALIENLAATGKREHWARLYWLTEDNNEAAQKLYKNLGLKLNFSLHVLPLH